jgi:hypothetical protein
MIGLMMTLLAIYFYGIEKKRYLSVFLVIGLSTACFQLVPLHWMLLPQIGITKSFDWPFLLCGFILLFYPHVFFQRALWLRYKWLIAFSLTLLFLLFYSIKFAGVETSVSIRVLRGYIYFILLFPFAMLRQEDFIKVFRLVVYVVTISSLMYCIQPLIHMSLLNATTNPNPEFHEESGMMRFYNLPGLVFPVMFIVFFPKNTFRINCRYLLSAINFGAIIISQNRSMLLVLVLCFMLHQVITGKMKPARMVAYALAGLLVYTAVDTMLGNRFSDGFKDLSTSSFSTTAAKVTTSDLYTMSTSEFRWYHVVERTEFILQDKWTTLFGIGLLTEDSRAANMLHFTVGNPDETGAVPQIATGDIAWSVLFLHMGLLGTAVFLLMYLSFLRRFFAQRKNDMLKVALYQTLTMLLTSVYGTSIFLPHHLCILVFFVAYLYHNEKEAPAVNRRQYSYNLAIA